MLRFVHGLFILAMNAVPIVGVLFFGWSAGTLLIVIWAEVLLVSVANVLRILLHRNLTRARGHYRLHIHDKPAASLQKKEKPKSGTLLSEYSTLAFVFTLAHGLFLAAILAMFSQNWRGEGPSPWAIDPVALRNGILAVTALTALELLVDLVGLREKPFSWLKQRVQLALGQVVIVHLAIVFGTFLVVRYETPLVYLAIIVGLKALVELGSSRPPRELPENPPRWLAAIAKKQGLDMDRKWKEIIAEEKRKTIDDELPLAVR